MRRLATLFLILFFLSASAVAQQTPAPQQSKQITDPAEYNTYVAAINEQNSARKIQLLDEFLAKYPNTVVREDALELKLVTQQQAGQPFEQTARQILGINPNNFRSLLVLSYLFVQTPLSEQDPQYQQKLSNAEALAGRGIARLSVVPRPENVSEADYQKSKNAAEATFHQVLGLVARHRKDFPASQTELKKAAELASDDAAVLYRLGDAYIAEKPPKYTEAFWAFARAVMIEGPGALPAAGKTQVNDYLSRTYTQYHGSAEGLDKLKESAKASPFPPSGFRIVPKSELQAGPAPGAPAAVSAESMSFGQIKEVLSAGGEKAKELWAKLKGQSLALEGKVVSAIPAARPRTIRLAVLPTTAASYDVHLALAAPSARPIVSGRMVRFEGLASDYSPAPFLLRMTEGKVTPAGPAGAQGTPRRTSRPRRRS